LDGAATQKKKQTLEKTEKGVGVNEGSGGGEVDNRIKQDDRQ